MKELDIEGTIYIHIIRKEGNSYKSNKIGEFKMDEVAICPYCEGEIKKFSELKSISKGGSYIKVLYFCPHCKKILGITSH